MSAYPLPTPEGATEMLSNLLGRKVTVSEGDAIAPDAAPMAMISSFTDDTGIIALACICDIGFVCNAGAALSMLPAGGAEDCVDSGEVSDTINENFYEVMNITSLLFNDQEAPRLILREMLPMPGSNLPDDLGALVASPAGQANFKIKIAGYGEGGMSLLLANVR